MDIQKAELSHKHGTANGFGRLAVVSAVSGVLTLGMMAFLWGRGQDKDVSARVFLTQWLGDVKEKYTLDIVADDWKVLLSSNRPQSGQTSGEAAIRDASDFEEREHPDARFAKRLLLWAGEARLNQVLAGATLRFSSEQDPQAIQVPRDVASGLLDDFNHEDQIWQLAYYEANGVNARAMSAPPSVDFTAIVQLEPRRLSASIEFRQQGDRSWKREPATKSGFALLARVAPILVTSREAPEATSPVISRS